jgi:hypothetical protein
MKSALCLLFVIISLLFLPVSTTALIDTGSSSYFNKERVEEITQTTQEVNSADKIPVQLYDGKYFAFSPTVSVMFVKTGDSVKGIVYRHNELNEIKGDCAFGAINNKTHVMHVWEIYSLPVQLVGDIVQVKFNGEEESFDLETMEIETKSQFEEHYKAMGYSTLWQEIWKEFTDCGNFFSLLNVK